MGHQLAAESVSCVRACCALASQDGWALVYASEGLRGDREIVMQAIAQSGRALQFASEELRGDPEIVMQAIAQRWEALQFASEELRGDRKIVMQAIVQSGWALEFRSGDCNASDCAERMGIAVCLRRAEERHGHSKRGTGKYTLQGRCCVEGLRVHKLAAS